MARFRIRVDDNDVPKKIRWRIRRGVKASTEDLTREMEKRAKRTIRREGAIWTRELLNSFQDADYHLPGRTRASLKNLADHAPYQEEGVSGIRTKRDTPYEYTDTRPPLEALIPWVEDKLVGTGFWPKGVPLPGKAPDLPDEEETEDALVASAAADAGGIEIVEPDEPPEEVSLSIDEWSNLTIPEALKRFWVDQEVTYRKNGEIHTHRLSRFDEQGLIFRWKDKDGVNRVHLIPWGDTDDVVTRHENWGAQGPLQRRQIIYNNVVSAQVGDLSDLSDGGEERGRKILADFIAFEMTDASPLPNAEDVALRLSNAIAEVNKKDHASIGTHRYGIPFIRWQMGAPGADDPNLTPANRDYWTDVPTMWHELQHAITRAYLVDSANNLLAKKYNNREFDSFMGGIIPAAFKSTGHPSTKFEDQFPDLLSHARVYMFENLFVGDTWDSQTSRLNSPIGWSDWKDDIDLTVPWNYVDWDNLFWKVISDRYTLLGGTGGDEPDLAEGDAVRFVLDNSPDVTRRGVVTDIRFQPDRGEENTSVWIFEVNQDDGASINLVTEAETGNGRGVTVENFATDVTIEGEPRQPTAWEPNTGHPVRDLAEAANRAWWKQTRILASRINPDIHDYEQMRKFYVMFPYSMSNAQETIAMGTQLLFTDAHTTKVTYEGFYRTHPYLVKAILRVWGGSPRAQRLLREVAEDEGFDDLLDLLDSL